VEADYDAVVVAVLQQVEHHCDGDLGEGLQDPHYYFHLKVMATLEHSPLSFF
jgi:hypothetical protein